MLIPRIIPCLLLQKSRLVKGIKFKNHNYLGDPINAVKVFNDKEVDEIIFLDIMASQASSIQYDLLAKIASEAFVPITYGGGIKTADEAKKILKLGVEKISLNSSAFDNPSLIKELSDICGSSSVVVSIDVKKNIWGNYVVMTKNGSVNTKNNPVEYALNMEKMGCGEILLNNIDLDGTMAGFDIALIREVSSKLSIPLIACGGGSNLDNLVEAVKSGGAAAAAAGSLFVYHGRQKGVLINFPQRSTLESLFLVK